LSPEQTQEVFRRLRSRDSIRSAGPQGTINRNQVQRNAQQRALNQATDRAEGRLRERAAASQDAIGLRNLAASITGRPSAQQFATQTPNQQSLQALNNRASNRTARRRFAANRRMDDYDNRRMSTGGDQPTLIEQRYGVRHGEAIPVDRNRTTIQGSRTTARRPSNTLNPQRVQAGQQQRGRTQYMADKAAREEARRLDQLKLKAAGVQKSRNRGLQAMGARQGTGAAGNARFADNVAAPRGEGGQRLFTPQNRAAVSRERGNQLRVVPGEDGATKNVYYSGGKMAVDEVTGTPGSPFRTHDISFRSADLNKGYDRPAERAARGQQVLKKSKGKKALESATIKNNLANVFRGVGTGEKIWAAPLDTAGTGRKARARLYERLTNGVLQTPPNSNVAQATRGGKTTWRRGTDDAQIEWNPEDLRKDINKLAAQTPKQLVGRTAGGNSSLKIKGKGAKTKTTGQSAQARRANDELNRMNRQRRERVSERQSILREIFGK